MSPDELAELEARSKKMNEALNPSDLIWVEVNGSIPLLLSLSEFLEFLTAIQVTVVEAKRRKGSMGRVPVLQREKYASHEKAVKRVPSKI